MFFTTADSIFENIFYDYDFLSTNVISRISKENKDNNMIDRAGTISFTIQGVRTSCCN